MDKKVTLTVFGQTVVVSFDETTDEFSESALVRREAAKQAIIDLISTYGETQNEAASVRFYVL